MKTNSSHSSSMRAIRILIYYYGNLGTRIHLLESYTNSHLSYGNLHFSFLWELLIKDMRAPILFLLEGASVSVRTLIFIIF
jgi:hypothetical protein